MSVREDKLFRQKLRHGSAPFPSNGVSMSSVNFDWMISKKYKKASTKSILDHIQDLKDNTVKLIKKAIKTKDVILESSLTFVGGVDPFAHLDIEQRREKVRKYISKTYPYWEKVSADNPSHSVDMLISQIKLDFPNYASLLDTLCATSIAHMSDEDLMTICALSQKLISLCVFYVHVKRFPEFTGTKTVVYRNPIFCGEVDLEKWSKIYTMELS